MCTDLRFAHKNSCLQQQRVGNGEARNGGRGNSRLADRQHEPELCQSRRGDRLDGGEDRRSRRYSLRASQSPAVPRPALIDVVTDANALSMPSHISADQVQGFGVAMMKLVLSGHIDEVVDTVEANIRDI